MLARVLIAIATAVVALALPARAEGEASLLTSLVANAASADPSFDVLTRDDVKKALAVEAEKQSMGCGDQSCLAELAGAMGARVVIYGSVGRLADEMLLTLNLFDSASGSSGGRRVARAPDLRGLSKLVEPTTTELLKAFLQANPVAGGGRVKLLVIDLEVQDVGDTSAATSAAPAGGPPMLGIAGLGVLGLGVAGVVVGGVFDGLAVGADTAARDKALTQNAAQAKFAESDTDAFVAGLGYIGGGVLVVVGAVVATLGFVSE